ncbi:MAG: hypothetical protein ACUVTB_07805 [Candidatus Bathycorpusculaceae bacterium]
MSLSQLYRLKRKVENKQDEKTLEEAENLKAKLEKIAIPPDIAKAWATNGCGKPC